MGELEAGSERLPGLALLRGGRSTLTDHFDRHRRERPDQVFVHFVRCGEVAETLTFAALAAGAAQYARLYHQRGLAGGDVVLVMLNHSPEQYLAFLGAVLAGLTPSFMPFPSSKQDPQLFWSAHRKLIARIGKAALVTYPENRASLMSNLGEPSFPVLVPQDRLRQADDWLAADSIAEDIALLQHTSGTTGLKKGIALSHRAILNQVEHYAAALRIGAGASIASWLPLYHDMGLVACFLLPLVLALPVVAIDPFEWIVRPGTLLAMIERFRTTHIWMPNFAFQHLSRHQASLTRYDLGSVQAFINCSEPCRAETFAEFARCFGGAGVRPTMLQVCYAAAETTFAVTQTPYGEAARVVHVDEQRLERDGIAVPTEDAASSGARRPLVSCGVPIDGVSVRVLDNVGRPLPEGRVGEIAIAGDALFSEYFRQPDETAQRLVAGADGDGDVDVDVRWYRSRDLGFVLDGELFVLGRTDDMIVSYGKNYFMHDLEHVCAGLAELRPGRSVAFGVFNPRTATHDLVIVAELARPEPGERTEQALKRELRRRIASDLMGEVQIIELVAPGWLLKTTSGKIMRAENRDKYLREHTARGGSVGPADPRSG